MPKELGDELRRGNDKMVLIRKDAKSTLKALDSELSVAAEE